MVAIPISPPINVTRGTLVAMESDSFCCFLYRIRRVAIHVAPAVVMRLPRGANQVAGSIEFGQQSVGSFA